MAQVTVQGKESKKGLVGCLLSASGSLRWSLSVSEIICIWRVIR